MQVRWSYTDRVSEARRALFNHVRSYEDIAVEIADGAMVTKAGLQYKRLKPKGGKGVDRTISRPVFRLTADADLIDVFHNGRDGYRARFLHSIECGEMANDLLIKLLMPKLRESWRRRSREPGIGWLEYGLAPRGAKVWIHQGPWSRGWGNRQIATELAVPTWTSHLNDNDACVRKKVKLGALCPRDDRINVMGLLLRKDGTVVEPKPFVERSRQIHLYGFT